MDTMTDPAGARLGVQGTDVIVDRLLASVGMCSGAPELETTTHILLSQRPTTSLNNYRAKKDELISLLSSSNTGIDDASRSLLSRMKEIGNAAVNSITDSEREGLAGLRRVEKAVEKGGKGLLGLLEGSGLE